MKKLIIVGCLAVLLTGCGRFERWWAGTTGNAFATCVNGVEYLQFTSGASVAYNTDSTVKLCKD